MATLDVRRLYSDGEVLTEAQIDAIREDIEELFNTTRINDDNIQNSGLTGSSVLGDGSVSTDKFEDDSIISAKIVDDAVTTAKLNDDAVTTAKIAANAVTAAKLHSLFLPSEEGAIRLFHTYNSTVDVPRGWMICNGDVVNETNYDAIHGSGAYSEDGISSSNLLSKNLPDMANLFAVGTNDTTQDGASAITSVGNTDSEIDVSHTHTLSSHTHGPDDPADTGGNTAIVTTSLASQTFGMSDELSSALNIEPESIDFLFLVRVI